MVLKGESKLVTDKSVVFRCFLGWGFESCYRVTSHSCLLGGVDWQNFTHLLAWN